MCLEIIIKAAVLSPKARKRKESRVTSAGCDVFGHTFDSSARLNEDYYG